MSEIMIICLYFNIKFVLLLFQGLGPRKVLSFTVQGIKKLNSTSLYSSFSVQHKGKPSAESLIFKRPGSIYEFCIILFTVEENDCT